MEIISAEALQALREDAFQSLNMKCTLADGNTFYITGADIHEKFEIERASLVGDKLEIGSAMMASLNFTLENESGKFTGIDFEGAELYPIVDVILPSGEKYPIKMGYFTVSQPPRKLELIDVVAYDRMAQFDRPYSTALSFPATVLQILEDSCRACGVPNSVSSHWINSDMSVKAAPVGDELTHRQVISWCAQVMGICLYINRDGRLDGRWYESTLSQIHPNINGSDRFKGYTSYAEREITSTGVKVESIDAQVSTAGSDEYAFQIKGNGLIPTGAEGMTVAESLRQLRMIKYRPVKCSTHSFPHLDPLDRMRFTKYSSLNLLTNGGEVKNHNEYLIKSCIPERELIEGERLTLTMCVTPARDVTSLAPHLSSGYVSVGDIKVTPQKKQIVSVTFNVSFAPGRKPTDNIKNNEIGIYRKPKPTLVSGNTVIHWAQLEEGDEFTGYKPYDGLDFETVLTNVKYALNGDSVLESKGKTAEEEKRATYPPFTARQQAILEAARKKAEQNATKRITQSEQMILELNKLMSNSFGFYITQKQDAYGGIIVYQHDKPRLEDSKIIYKKTAEGFAWTKGGWNGGNPIWTNGIDAEGNAILNTIAVYKLHAEYVTTGILSSKSGEFSINMDTGESTFSNIHIKGGDIDLDGGKLKIRTEQFGIDLSDATVKMYNAPTQRWESSRKFFSIYPVSIIKDFMGTEMDWYLGMDLNGQYDDGLGHRCVGYRIGKDVGSLRLSDGDDPWTSDWAIFTEKGLEARQVKSRSTFTCNENSNANIATALRHFRVAPNGKSHYYLNVGMDFVSNLPKIYIEAKGRSGDKLYIRLDIYSDQDNRAIVKLSNWIGEIGHFTAATDSIYWNGRRLDT